jgi:hypothetical protein
MGTTMKVETHTVNNRRNLAPLRLALKTAALLAVISTSVAFYGCVTAPEPVAAAPLPTSPWGDKYAYSYEPKLQQGKSVPVNIAVVDPYYRHDENTLKLKLYSKVAKGFSASMGVDLDKILIKKGFTASGPFPALDEITYSEKKGATVTLYPQIFITAEVKLGDKWRYPTYAAPNDGSVPVAPQPRPEGRMMKKRSAMGAMSGSTGGSNITVAERDFKITITGWISFEMREPLSGEKLWIKKLELDTVELKGVEIFATEAQYTEVNQGLLGVQQVFAGWKTTDKMLFDGKADAMADYLKTNYPVIMGKFETYLDSEELLSLKEKAKEIRDRGNFKL